MAVFADLPAEIRLQIWELTAVPTQAVFIWGKAVRPPGYTGWTAAVHPYQPQVLKPRFPAALNICAESRAHLLSPALAARYHIGKPLRPWDPSLDVVFIQWPEHMRRMLSAIDLAVRYGNPDPWPARTTHLALSHACMDTRDGSANGDQRRALLHALLAHRPDGGEEGPRRGRAALREVSLVAPTEGSPGGEIDLISEAQCVALAEWSGAGVGWRRVVEVEAMHAELASEVAFFDGILARRGEEGLYWTVVSVKRMFRLGTASMDEVDEARNWWRMNVVAERLVGLARWWRG